MPDMKERVQIFNVHLKNVKTDPSVDVDFLARQTPGFSGADIANICNEAALIAARHGAATVEQKDFLAAVDRIIGGLEKKNKIITPNEKRAIAFHEAGHAVTSWLLEYASPLVKVTIVPRGRSLGAAWYLPEERQITTTDQILDEMCATLGGRAAEQVIFGKISTGALSDLEKVTKQAYAMVGIYGLNDRIGNLSYYDSSGESQFTKPYSDVTARTMDEEVSKLVEAAYQRALHLLTENREKLEELAQLLLDKEVIFKEDLERVLGVRPYIDRQTQIDEAETTAQIEKDRLDAANAPVIEATENTTPIAEESQDEKAADSNETPTTEES
jgi:cell division protease FtsH